MGTRQAHHDTHPVEILHESILRGLTGTLTAGREGASGHTIHLMQGEIVGAEGPDDDIWLVRRLTAQGAITERQGVAFTRSIERNGTLDAHLLDELPAPLHIVLRAGRFQQNILEFLRSPDPVRFERERTMFRDNAEVGHDSGRLLRELTGLRDRVAGLQQQVHGGHTLRPGPAGPADADQARLLDLVDPAMSLHDLVTFSPFEEGRTLALVRDMVECEALRADPPLRLDAAQPGPGSSPDLAHADEDLFSAGSSMDDLVQIAVEGPARHDAVLGRLSMARQLVSGFGDLAQFDAPVLEDGDWGDAVPVDYGGLHAEPRELALDDVFDDELFDALAEEDAPAPAPEPPRPAASEAATPKPAATEAATPEPATPEPSEPPAGEQSLRDIMARSARRADANDSARALIQPPSLQPPAEAPVREEALVEETPSEDFPAIGGDLAAALADATAAVEAHPFEEADDEDFADDATAPMLRPQATSAVEDLFDLGEDALGVEDFADERTEEAPRSPAPVRDLRQLADPPASPGARGREPSPSELDTAEAAPLEGDLPAQMVETLFDDGLGLAPAGADPGAPAFEEAPTAEDLQAAPAEEPEPAPEPLEELEEPQSFDGPLLAADVEPLDDEPAPLAAVDEPAALEAMDEAEALEALHVEDEPVAASDVPPEVEDEPAPLPAIDAPAEPPEEPSVDAGPSPEVEAALRRAEEQEARREFARHAAEYDEDDLLVSHPPRTDLFDFGDDVDDDEMAMFQDHDRFRGGGQGQFTLSKQLLDHVDLNEGGPESGNLPPPVEFPAGFGAPEPEPVFAEDGDDDGLLAMGDAESASLTDADKVVALNFSAPRLELSELDRKLRVATEVLGRISTALDDKLGPGAGQASVQLLLDGAPSAYAVVFQGLEARLDGTFDVSAAARNIKRRPEGEHRRLIDNGTMDLIERGLSYAVAELDDQAMDALLEGIAGYQQRLRS